MKDIIEDGFPLAQLQGDMSGDGAPRSGFQQLLASEGAKAALGCIPAHFRISPTGVHGFCETRKGVTAAYGEPDRLDG